MQINQTTDYILLKNITITNCSSGFIIDNSNNLKIINNTIFSTIGIGVDVNWVNNLYLINNTIENTGNIGISAYHVTSSIIKNNNLINNSNCTIKLDNTLNITINYNNILSTKLVFSTSSDSALILAIASGYLTIAHNQFKRNSADKLIDGIDLTSGTYYVTIDSNNLSFSRIIIWNIASFVNVTNNVIVNADNALGTDFNTDHILFQNNIIVNANIGLDIGTDFNTAFNNAFYDSNNGVVISGTAKNNEIYYNYFQDIHQYVIDFYYYYGFPENNSIYENTFMNNSGVYAINNANSWEFLNHGNYWEAYHGQDSNKDGIGDQPFLISKLGCNNSGNIYDDFPLINVTFTPDNTLVLYAKSLENKNITYNQLMNQNGCSALNLVTTSKVNSSFITSSMSASSFENIFGIIIVILLICIIGGGGYYSYFRNKKATVGKNYKPKNNITVKSLECSNCHTLLKPDDIYCYNCGNKRF